MTGYYGIADFAGGFNRVRDDSLNSGFRAKKQMRDDWMENYQVPEKMLTSDVNALNKSIAYDTLNQGYGDLVNYGLNNAAFGAKKSGINLSQLDAEHRYKRKRARAITEGGARNDYEIAQWIKNNPDPEDQTNPYLVGNVYDNDVSASQKYLATGLAIGGPLGIGMANKALPNLGYDFQGKINDSGNVYFQGDGGTTSPYTEGAQIPLAQAFTGDVGPMAKRYNWQENTAVQNAREAARLNLQAENNYLRHLLGENREARLRQKNGIIDPHSPGAQAITGMSAQATTPPSQAAPPVKPATQSPYQAPPSLPEAQTKLSQARAAYQTALTNWNRVRRLAGGNRYDAISSKNLEKNLINPKVVRQAELQLEQQFVQAGHVLKQAEQMHRQAALAEEERQRMQQAQQLIQALQQQ